MSSVSVQDDGACTCDGLERVQYQCLGLRMWYDALVSVWRQPSFTLYDRDTCTAYFDGENRMRTISLALACLLDHGYPGENGSCLDTLAWTGTLDHLLRISGAWSRATRDWNSIRHSRVRFIICYLVLSRSSLARLLKFMSTLELLQEERITPCFSPLSLQHCVLAYNSALSVTSRSFVYSFTCDRPTAILTVTK